MIEKLTFVMNTKRSLHIEGAIGMSLATLMNTPPFGRWKGYRVNDLEGVNMDSELKVDEYEDLQIQHEDHFDKIFITGGTWRSQLNLYCPKTATAIKILSTSHNVNRIRKSKGT